MHLKIGSRKSDLAQIQAFSVGQALQKTNPHITVSYHFKESLGDKNLQDPLWKMPEKGVFTEDFFESLLSGEIDMVVHSWKDLPVEERFETTIAATLRRADVRDIFLLRKDKVKGLCAEKRVTIFTSSPRRAFNLSGFLKEALPFKIEKVEFRDIRGNIPTRLQKFLSGTVDGIILAKAALDRLLESSDFPESQKIVRAALHLSYFMVLPLKENPAAPAQGALAVEVLKKRTDLASALKKINVTSDFSNVVEERRVLASYGGGCHQKIGATQLTRPYGNLFFLRGLTDSGENLSRVELKDKASELGEGTKSQASSAAQLWPEKKGEGLFFERRFFDVPIGPFNPSDSVGLWVSKAEALPLKATFDLGQIVWVSGVETWKKLAQRGVWVNGTAESLGEHEDPQLQNICSRNIYWKKLTHTRGFTEETEGLRPKSDLICTYELIPLKANFDLSEKTHFFWMSGSQFLEAVTQFPAIAKKEHGAGPGNTALIIARYLGESATNFRIYLNYDDWKQKVVGT